MDKNNSVTVCGALMGKPEFSHIGRDGEYYGFPLGIERLSGAMDMINIIARKELLEATEVAEKSRVRITGELRSFNNRSGLGSKLVITVFAQKIELTEEKDENSVELVGTLCKPANFRKTPMGRVICDMMVAVNRRYGRSDYLPCIAWGQLAETAALWDAGTQIHLVGRIQSRNYIKNEEGTPVEKTAYEVSAAQIELLS